MTRTAFFSSLLIDRKRKHCLLEVLVAMSSKRKDLLRFLLHEEHIRSWKIKNKLPKLGFIFSLKASSQSLSMKLDLPTPLSPTRITLCGPSWGVSWNKSTVNEQLIKVFHLFALFCVIHSIVFDSIFLIHNPIISICKKAIRKILIS